MTRSLQNGGHSWSAILKINCDKVAAVGGLFHRRREHKMSGTMNRDTLLYRASLIWLAVLTAGFVDVLLQL
jgi:hypothetical protein